MSQEQRLSARPTITGLIQTGGVPCGYSTQMQIREWAAGIAEEWAQRHREEERAQIVKWLRWKANLDSDLASRDRYTPGYVDAANAIERRDDA